MTDWGKRANELAFFEARYMHGDIRVRALDPSAAIQLGREMADERAEEIAKRLETALMGDLRCTPASFSADAANIARSFIQKPKTREQVLEEALRHYTDEHLFGADSITAKQALEWKP